MTWKMGVGREPSRALYEDRLRDPGRCRGAERRQADRSPLAPTPGSARSGPPVRRIGRLQTCCNSLRIPTQRRLDSFAKSSGSLSMGHQATGWGISRPSAYHGLPAPSAESSNIDIMPLFCPTEQMDSQNPQKVTPMAKPLKSLSPATVHGVVFAFY